MKIVIEEIGKNEEEELILRCHEMNEELLRLIQHIRTVGNGVVGFDGSNIHRLRLEDIFYFEVVDNKAFLYCDKEVYESKWKLYEFEAFSKGSSFFRASKSVILNADKIAFIRPAFSGRFEAVLLNKEKVIVSRQYVGELKKIMGV